MMKKYFLKIALILFFFLGLIGIELFVLPIDYFTFRVWEAVKVSPTNTLLQGPFYPKQYVSKLEEGDLGAHTPFAVRKEVIWETDSFGYRKHEQEDPRYDIVILGDSNVVGSAVTQTDMISEVLEGKIKKSVYPMAPATMDTFFQQQRFRDRPPKVVILEAMERTITSLPPVKKSDSLSASLYEKGIAALNRNESFVKVSVLLDRLLYKKNMLHYLEARLRTDINGKETANKQIWANDQSMLFLQGLDANKEVSSEELNRVVNMIKSYNQAFAQQNIRFIFLPLPNKENLYYEKITGSKKPVFLEQLIAELKKNGVETIDTQSALNEARDKNPNELLFHVDDTHVNSRTMSIVADLLAEHLAKNQPVY